MLLVEVCPLHLLYVVTDKLSGNDYRLNLLVTFDIYVFYSRTLRSLKFATVSVVFIVANLIATSNQNQGFNATTKGNCFQECQVDILVLYITMIVLIVCSYKGCTGVKGKR